MRRRGRLRAALVAAVITLAGCASATHEGSAPAGTSRTPPGTQHVVFVPTPAVARTVHGSCWTSSITVSATAYRCLAGTAIYDPCFPSIAARSVLCYADPWSRAVRIDVTTPLPTPDPLAVSHPWALELRDGTRCVAVTGVVARVGDVPMLYRCGPHGLAGVASGPRNTITVPYTATGAAPLQRRAVGVVWRSTM